VGERRAELEAGLADVRARVAAACQQAGRDVAEVTTVVVTKTFPASDVALLASLGVRDVGESKDQEASAKAAELADLGLRWHVVGRLQTNKARSVAGYAHLVHSLDRGRLVSALSRGAAERRDAGGAPALRCLVQVSLDEDPRRGGAVPDDVPALADSVAQAEALELAGVMAIAPQGREPARAFARLVEVAERLRRNHPGAVVVSAGMSGDLDAAVAAGATHLRVGSAVLGSRPPQE
jgi:pyridoxal phosphate enzyme (YggS family)